MKQGQRLLTLLMASFTFLVISAGQSAENVVAQSVSGEENKSLPNFLQITISPITVKLPFRESGTPQTFDFTIQSTTNSRNGYRLYISQKVAGSNKETAERDKILGKFRYAVIGDGSAYNQNTLPLPQFPTEFRAYTRSKNHSQAADATRLRFTVANSSEFSGSTPEIVVITALPAL